MAHVPCWGYQVRRCRVGVISCAVPRTVQKRHDQVSFYLRRVFIVDDCDDLMPEWLYSVSGTVDSDVHPLHIQGEDLQHEVIL